MRSACLATFVASFCFSKLQEKKHSSNTNKVTSFSILFLCISLFTIGFASYCQQTIADFNLQGKIKKSMVIRSAISNEWPTDTASYLFNNDGVLIEEIEAHKHSMECTNIKTYDSKGHITLQECTGCKKSTKWVNTYNKAGLLTKIEVPFDLLTTTMSYDSLNNLTSVAAWLIGNDITTLSTAAFLSTFRAVQPTLQTNHPPMCYPNLTPEVQYLLRQKIVVG